MKQEKFLHPLILAFLTAGLLHMSWHKWVNITLDYGRELYVPWRITCGQVLYKDIASLYGPFPPYWNALLFKVFGVSIMTLVLFNIFLVIGITILIYRTFSYTMDRRTALFASVAFLIILAFRQGITNQDQGNFSFICPYSHGVTYAVFFSLWAIDCFASHSRLGRDALLGVSGVFIGLTALCRFEIFIFLGLAIASGFISGGIIGRWPLQRFLKAGALLLGGFCAPIGIAYLYFSTQLPISRVASSILGFTDQWREILRINYYQYITGLDHPGHNFKTMLTTAAFYGLVIIAFKCLYLGRGFFKKSDKRWQGVIFVLLGLAGIAQVAIWILRFPYDEIFRGLPVMIIIMMGYLSLLLWRHQRDENKISLILPLWVMTVWGLLMLTKVFLNSRVNSEGFVYAMPAVILFIGLFQYLIPQYFEQVYPKNHFVRTLASVLLLLIFIVGLRSIAHIYQLRNFPVRIGSDIIICKKIPWYPNDVEISEIADFLKNADKIMSKDANFVVFPQGAILNFLTKRVNPLPHITIMGAEVVSFGEHEILRSFKEYKPDYVVLSSEMPLGYLTHRSGIRYAFTIKAWILANYRPVWPAHPEMDNMITVYKRSQ